MAEEIVQDGNPALRKKAKPLSHTDITAQKTRALIARMKDLLKGEENGVGLAAPQIGMPLRLFIVSGRAFAIMEKDEDTEGKKEEKAIPPDVVFINPELVRTSRTKKRMDEGCLSVRGLYGVVMRHEKATVKALDEHGKSFIRHGTGLIAQIFQHEIDHLDGILYTDKAIEIEKLDADEEKGKPRKRAVHKKLA